MLRTSIAKFKRACSIAHVPGILRDDAWCSASNLEKLSAILLTRYKNTTSGSNDDEDKNSKKCKQLIEMAFGPDKLDAAERIEKIDVRKKHELESMISTDVEKVTCEKSDKIGTEEDSNKELDVTQYNVLNTTKVEQEENIVHNIEKSDETPIADATVNMQHEESKSEKCKKLIELMFGPSKPQNLHDSKISKLPELETENMTQMVSSEFTKSEIENKNINSLANEGVSNKEMDLTQVNMQKVLNATKVEDEEKLVQKLEKIEETPLVDADINNKRPFLQSKKHHSSKGYQINDSGIIEELAKRCLNSSDDKIDSNILKEMKKLGISQPPLEDILNDKSVNIQKSTMISKETPRALEKDKVKTSRRNMANRRAMKHLAMRMGTDNISDVKSSDEKQKLNIQASNKKDQTAIPIVQGNTMADREILVDREKPLTLTETVPVNVVQKEIEKLNPERTEFQHARLIKCSEDVDDLPATSTKEKEQESKVNKSTVIMDEKIRDEPAVLIKDCDDPDGFRITPNTPTAETLSSRLAELNKQVQQSKSMCETLQRLQQEQQEKEQTLLIAAEKAESAKLNKEIEKIFTDERIPRHLFAELTVITKNLSPETKQGKTLKDFFEQENEKETTLIKPERLRYYSHNDEILKFRDCSDEVNPHVVIREYEDYESDPTTDKETYSNNNYYTVSNTNNNHYNYQENMYNQGNVYENNHSDQSETSQNMNYYNKIMTNSVTPGCNNNWNAALPSNLWTTTGYNDMSSNSNVTNKCDANFPTPSINNPNQVLIDPYGKNMKWWEDDEDTDQVNIAGVDKGDEIETLQSVNPHEKENLNSVNPNENENLHSVNSIENENLHSVNINENENLYSVNPNKKENLNSVNPNEKKDYSDFQMDPLLTSRYGVDDGTMTSGNQSKDTSNKNLPPPNVSPKTFANPWIDKGAISAGSMKCNARIDAQEPVKICPEPDKIVQEPENSCSGPLVMTPAKEETLTLSEMLKRVRERARLETCQEREILIASPVTKVDPTEDACKKPKPPCPPPQKTCPPTPPKCPPSNCPEPQPPCPKPCKPACPDPCSTPKCPPPEKKDPCAKFLNKKPVDILGLVVTLGTLNIPHAVAANKILNDNNIVMPLLVESILLKLYGALMPEIKDRTLIEEDDIYLPDVRLGSSFYFPRDYEPWTPIPSWPIPSKRFKKKLVCPQEGCKVRPPPPPGARCDNIHQPCAGFPNDKKRT